MSDKRHDVLSGIVGTREAAEMLELTPRHITRLAESGELQARRLGREWAISEQSVREFKARRSPRSA